MMKDRLRGRPAKSSVDFARDVPTSPVLVNALRVFDCFLTGGMEKTLRDIRVATGLHNSTLLRVLSTLVAQRYLVRSDDGLYAVGVKGLLLGGMVESNHRLRGYVEPVLAELSRKTRESATFWVPDGERRIAVSRVESPLAVRDHVEAVLATGPRDRIRGAASADIVIGVFADPGWEQRKIPDLPVFTRNANVAGLGSISAPVFWKFGFLGTLTLTGPSERFDATKVKSGGKMLWTAAARLCEELGGQEYWSALQPESVRLKA